MMNCYEQLQRHEGFRDHYYLCTAGKKTIGYGRNVEAKPLPVELQRDFDVYPMTESEAESLLISDVSEVQHDLEQKLDFDYKQFSKPRQAVLINMAYNLGIHGLMKFKKFLAALKVEDYVEASYQMLDSKWANQVGNRAIELSIQMNSGSWHEQ